MGTSVVPDSTSITAHVRPDNTNSVVFLGTDGNLYEASLALGGGSWKPKNLTGNTGAPSAASRAIGYERADGVTAYVYSARNGSLYEITVSGSSWGRDQIVASQVLVEGYPYVRSDGVNAIVGYGNVPGQSVPGTEENVVEVAGTPGSWIVNDLGYWAHEAYH
jgi:hypothetical protein